MKSYNGHRSWNAWNVALWIGNTEGLYNFALMCIDNASTLDLAVNKFMNICHNRKTPDGAIYNRLSVKLALEGLMEE